MSEHDWTEVVGAFGVFALIITVVTTTIIQIARTKRTKMAAGRKEDYRKLAETAVRAQEGTEHRLAELGSRLASMEARMTSLERVLKDVE
ncbi:hypothetical protein [Plantactinospora endophytica]|uniref:Uncharacterized protein n=1 Tax=Plantactinospora endophytica TaxID=673535 RepID=A0ABQ4E2X6_9ACTN|nr:hypothetical protein [Plantactinospora endophytica]GIG89047.1 hypothetical protein Pen02_39830 [Plantactinospora endophytica]